MTIEQKAKEIGERIVYPVPQSYDSAGLTLRQHIEIEAMKAQIASVPADDDWTNPASGVGADAA